MDIPHPRVWMDTPPTVVSVVPYRKIVDAISG